MIILDTNVVSEMRRPKPDPAVVAWLDKADAQDSDAVVVTSRSLAPRFEAWGANVCFVPHGVDLFPWRPATPRARARFPARSDVGRNG